MPWETQQKNVIKYKGQCRDRSMWLYCYFWKAKKARGSGKTLGYFCSLFEEDMKTTGASVSNKQCNKKYGKSYRGNVSKSSNSV
jgi:hypothetical protein